MSIAQRLEYRHSQSLVMSPKLMQAIKLLRLSNLDLMTFVEEELERNPPLERASGEAAGVESLTRVGEVSAEQPGGGRAQRQGRRDDHLHRMGRRRLR